MKKVLAIFILSSALVGCGSSSTLMRTATQKPDLKSGNDAMLVVVRNTSLGTAFAVQNYLDKKLIGETEGKTYFIARVSPGMHYVISECENITAIRMNFKPGKVYYLHQDMWMGMWKPRSGYTALNPKEAKEAIAKCEFWELDKTKPAKDLDPVKYEQGLKDYQTGLKNDPKGYTQFIEYPGYNLE